MPPLDAATVSAFLWKLLAVAGGFVGGFVAALVGGIAFDKGIVRGKSPDVLHKVARYTGGLLVAAVVAFIVFRGGTGTGGSGTGTGDGTGANPEASPTATTSPAPSGQPVPPQPDDPKVSVQAVFVTVHAGKNAPPVARATGVTDYQFFEVKVPTEGGTRAEKMALDELLAEANRRKQGGAVYLVYDFGPGASMNTAGYAALTDDPKLFPLVVISKDQYRAKLKPAP